MSGMGPAAPWFDFEAAFKCVRECEKHLPELPKTVSIEDGGCSLPGPAEMESAA